MYQLKHLAQDFIVEEVQDLSLKEDGKYALFLLKKNNVDTFSALLTLTQFFSLSERDIGIAGIKDKRAVTTQYLSFPTQKVKKKDYTIGSLTLEFQGYANEKIFPGGLLGNRFTLTVRGISSLPEKKKFFINYFGEQRFSSRNAEVGKCLIQKKWQEAVTILLEDKAQGNQYSLTDPFGTIRSLSKKKRMFYVHAYQSLLWNKCVERYTKEKPLPSEETQTSSERFPLLGFGLDTDSKKEQICEQLMEEEGISFRDFVHKELPDISLESSERRIYTMLDSLTISPLADDPYFEGMFCSEFSFFLPKGSYATEAIRQLFEKE